MAFVLSGGGNLGALQVGMLKALAEREIAPDVVLGCSVGAMNGAAYCIDPTIAGVERLERVWAGAASDELMPSSRIPSTLQMIRKGESLHDAEGLRTTIERFLAGRQTFDELLLPFQCVATDVDAALERWFDSGPLVPAVQASAALPSVFPMVTIDEHRYVDGGVVDNVPIGRAVSLGAKRIYVLQVGPHGRPDHRIRRPIDAFLLAYWIARNNRFARDLEHLPPGVEAIVFPADRPDLRYDDFSKTAELIERGHSSATEYLDRIEAEAAEEPGLAARLRSERLGEELREFVSRLRARRGQQRDAERDVELDEDLDEDLWPDDAVDAEPLAEDSG